MTSNKTVWIKFPDSCFTVKGKLQTWKGDRDKNAFSRYVLPMSYSFENFSLSQADELYSLLCFQNKTIQFSSSKCNLYFYHYWYIMLG